MGFCPGLPSDALHAAPCMLRSACRPAQPFCPHAACYCAGKWSLEAAPELRCSGDDAWEAVVQLPAGAWGGRFGCRDATPSRASQPSPAHSSHPGAPRLCRKPPPHFMTPPMCYRLLSYTPPFPLPTAPLLLPRLRHRVQVRPGGRRRQRGGPAGRQQRRAGGQLCRRTAGGGGQLVSHRGRAAGGSRGNQPRRLRKRSALSVPCGQALSCARPIACYCHRHRQRVPAHHPAHLAGTVTRRACL